MLKLKKIFSLGVMFAAVAAMVFSCAEDTPDDEGTSTDTTVTSKYTVSVANGGEYAFVINYNEYDENDPFDNISTRGEFFAGDTVAVFSGFKDGFIFDGWSIQSTGSVTFWGQGLELDVFVMPNKNVTLTAGWAEVPVAGPSVRFSWEGKFNGPDGSDGVHIAYIWASENDVAVWEDEVYSAYNNTDGYEATDIPLYDGAPGVPNALFSMDEPSTQYKSVYFATQENTYTAVCTVEDSDGAISDIVANYATEIGDDGYAFFEINFDVAGFLDGTRENGWVDDSFDTGDTDPGLVKAKAKGGKILKKVLKKGNVTYYVLRRPKK